ncbi:hypothetical protein Tco_1143399 [Tanacetum coccineum]
MFQFFCDCNCAETMTDAEHAPAMAPPFRTENRSLPRHMLGLQLHTIPAIPSQKFWDTICFDSKAVELQEVSTGRASGLISTKDTLKRKWSSFGRRVPAAKPRLEDTEEEILQKVLEESLTDAYPTQRGPLRLVVFRETDTGKLQPLPRKAGLHTIKAKAGSEPCVLDGPNLEHSDVEITDASSKPQPEHMDKGILEEPASSTGTLSSLQQLGKDFSFGDQFFNDKPSDAKNEKTTAEPKAESMVSVSIQQDTSVIPPMTSPVIGPVAPPNPNSSKVSLPLLTTTTTTSATTTTTTLPLPPQPQQGPSDPIIIKRMGELEELIANLVEENQALEAHLGKQGSRINKLETMDLPKMIREQTVEFINSQEIDRKINESVKEVVISSVKHAMRAPLRARFKDLPTSDMKEILLQRMLEENYDKGHADHQVVTPPKSGSSGMVTMGCYVKVQQSRYRK